MEPTMMSDVSAGASIVTLVALLANITVQSIKSRSDTRSDAKARQNGDSAATKADFQVLSAKLSGDISGVYVKIDGLIKGCFDRHTSLERELGGVEQRIKAIEGKEG